MPTRHRMLRAAAGIRAILLTATVDANNVNLFTLAGSPSTAVFVVYTIQSGVWIGSTSTGSPALNVPAFPAGSRIVIQNQGVIAGCGGAGNGGPGGDAIKLSQDVEIDNTTGTIGGGGGGGGQGVGVSSGISGADGGGGGGGRGSTGGAHGSNQVTGGSPAGTSTAGTRTARGLGAAGGVNSFYGNSGGGGGNGGDLGRGGSTSSPCHPGNSTRTGGASGKAVDLNGHTVTWIGGNNPSQVLGDVS